MSYVILQAIRYGHVPALVKGTQSIFYLLDLVVRQGVALVESSGRCGIYSWDVQMKWRRATSDHILSLYVRHN